MKIRGLQLTPSLFAILAATSVGLPVLAQTPIFDGSSRPNTIFENVTLTPHFEPDPTIVHGISGGPLSAPQVAERAETATGSCLGFVDTQPDHIMVLTESFSYLSLQVQSTEDTTLVVKGPGGSWCNDNSFSFNPGLAGEWLPGTYEIWVGSHRIGGYYPYIIQISKTQLTSPAPSALSTP